MIENLFAEGPSQSPLAVRKSQIPAETCVPPRMVLQREDFGKPTASARQDKDTLMNAKNILNLLEQLHSIDVIIHSDRCVLMRDKNATCMKCAEVCASNCISHQDGEPVIYLENCTGCGTCATTCPTCALEAYHPNASELYEACTEALFKVNGEVVIACEQLLQAADGLYDPEKVVGVKCLGYIEENLPLLLTQVGAGSVVLAQGTCSVCRKNSGSIMTAGTHETTDLPLITWSQNEVIRITQKLPLSTRRQKGSNHDPGSRDLLADIFETEKTAA